MFRLHFVHPSSVDGHLGCFHLLAAVNSLAVNVGVQISHQTLLLVLLGIDP